MALFKKNAKLTDASATKKPKRVTSKQASHDFVKAAKEFEQSRISDIERSRTIAWRIAIGACALALMCVAAVLMLTPLKEVRPYVIRVDNNTGQTDIVTMLSKSQSDYGEEIAKYFSALYVQLRESYDWYTIQEQVNRSLLFSDATEQQHIQNRFAMPSAPHKVFKDTKRVNIAITNTSIIDEKGLIQVRFTKSVEPVNGGTYDPQTGGLTPPPEVSNHIATLGYEYVNVPTLDDVRLINPLGFTVKTYRVDDVVGE